MKLLRMLWAMVTQDWHEQECRVCRETWWATVNHPEIGADLCAECEAKSFEEWVSTRKAFQGAA